ncbi:hypothetical protein PMAYCL1PPCAC_27343 [Pristionchus mayeri]|uniref:Uncharacterized protein n=2 Tax=Pristionchus mayeri TaxID=1317129 RepID=A0AAN5I920_9BILA|nr:hypothetical protein PMAYCL1PPCAC_27343 [Pristionchus mayeri]
MIGWGYEYSNLDWPELIVSMLSRKVDILCIHSPWLYGNAIVEELLRRVPASDNIVWFSTSSHQLANDASFCNGYLVQFKDHGLRIVHQPREIENRDRN